ncbi:beta-aspartate methyltransferase [Candidatus Formimonas warabiya]|uniref:Beta-aspartate methyltransferase n=2 Tax=Formimonas warabiya TaxID=1761012 RepID=A0A3G1KZ60_FORW1|nr:beta-aspartate methyltransferase [Candidatus Formimonas warabiya]
MKKALLYVNQFFGGVGGEHHTDFEPIIKKGPIGPGLALKGALKGAEITHTVICGDNFMASNQEEALKRIEGFLSGKEFNLFLAGPAFRAGRYGVNCGEMCKFMYEKYGVMGVTSMHEENPGVEMYRENPFYILKGSEGAAKMRQDIAAMAAFANKLIAGEEILWASAEGYFPRGIRKEVFVDKTSADRSVDMLLAKLNGQPFETEFKIEVCDIVKPAKAVDIKKAKIGFISTGGLVPKGNPDHLPSGTSTIFIRYDISGMDSLKPGSYECIHGGSMPDKINANPEVLFPLATLKQLEKEGQIGEVDSYFYSTTGNLTSMKNATRIGAGIAESFKDNNIDAAILTST